MPTRSRVSSFNRPRRFARGRRRVVVARQVSRPRRVVGRRRLQRRVRR